MQHVFIVGSKGIPGKYGGFETFLDKLTQYHQDNHEIRYHIACKGKQRGEFRYHNAHCFVIRVPNLGSAQAIYYDIAALRYCCDYIREHHIEHPILYILACRIGPFARGFHRKIHKAGGKLFINPDGHEWLRGKWPLPVKMYWKYSERLMVKHSDLVICDSRNIERYIQKSYAQYRPQTIYVAYGTDARKSKLAEDDQNLLSWYAEYGLQIKKYYLVVGRFVPENNFETIIREFMQSNVDKDLAIITNTNNKLQRMLKKRLRYENDARIKFVGTVYEQELLMKIRENAYGYIHGHEVGGTNPSLLESLGSTQINLLFDVGFNRECAEDSALYWKKDHGDLSRLLCRAEAITEEMMSNMGILARKKITEQYNWKYISDRYLEIFFDRFQGRENQFR